MTIGPTDGSRRPSRAESRACSAPLLLEMFPAGVPVHVTFWDGTSLGPSNGADLLRVASPRGLQHLLWAPGELGLARAYVAGDLDFEGDMEAVLRAFEDGMDGHSLGPRAIARIAAAAREAGALTLPPPRPPEEARPRRWRHSKRADAEAIRHHYDVGNDFYRLVLGPAMTYSCARFVERPTRPSTEAQAAKHELICRKLGLHERARAALARRGVRLGFDGHPCGVASRRATSSASPSATEQAALARLRVGGGRPRRPRRDPAPGLPRPRRRAVRRDLVDRHVRTRRSESVDTLLQHPARPARSTRPAAQSRHLLGRWVEARPRDVRRPIRVPRRRAARRR